MSSNIHGILLLDKPVGLSSNQALQKAKKLLNASKAGHTGSLDVLASGMLPLCFGEATKFSHYLLNADKRYITTAVLGKRTTTADAEGEVIETKTVPQLSLADWESILNTFRGPITQIPSMYSALKFQGQPLYALARKGITVDRKPRSISIYELRLLKQNEDSTVEMEVHCSKGTYIRNLIEDIGYAIECGAYVQRLRRIAVGNYSMSQMMTLEDLEILVKKASDNNYQDILLPISSALSHLSQWRLSSSEVIALFQGKPLCVDHEAVESIQLVDETQKFLGVGTISNQRILTSRRLINYVIR